MSECWGGFLTKSLSNADDLFSLIDGVRLMIKFDEWQNDPNMVSLILARANKAYIMGKKIHLVIDCFNSAHDSGDYHTSVNMPSLNKIPRMVGDIIRAFPPLWKVEVFNEPYYCKNHSQRITIKDYVAYVQAMAAGCAIGNFKGKLVASQSQVDRFWNWPHRDNKIEYGWEWQTESVWDHGNLEGIHSAILHGETTADGVINRINKDWYQGIPIGWRHPIDETELSIVGTKISTNSQQGHNMTTAVLPWARIAKLPITILTWGGKHNGFGDPGWPGEMHHVNKHNQLAKAAFAFYNFYGQSPPDNGDQPPPAYGGMDEILKAERDLRVTKKNWATGVGLRHAHRTIAHINLAITERDE